MMRAAFERFLTDTVQHAAFAGRNSQAAPSFQPSVPRRARVFDMQRLVLGRDGSQQIARSVAEIEGPVTIDPEDQIRLPDGTTPPIIAVNHIKDMDGSISHAEVYF